MNRYFATQNVRVIGCDIFIAQKEIPQISEVIAGLELKAIANRGTKVWPNQNVQFELCDVYQCRFESAKANKEVTQENLVLLLSKLTEMNFEFVHFEKLLEINSKRAYSDLKGS